MDEATIEAQVDDVIRKHKTTEIMYFPYVSGAVDPYKQRSKSFGTAVSLVGRAILRPTPEQVTVIGNGEMYDIAFLFSRTEMIAKFPAAAEGEWMSTAGEMTWWNRRFKIEKDAPSGQVGLKFLLQIILANTIEGHREP